MMQEQTRARIDARFGNIELGKEQRPYGFDNVRDGSGLALINNIEGGCERLPRPWRRRWAMRCGLARPSARST